MLRILPLIIAILLSLSNINFQNSDVIIFEGNETQTSQEGNQAASEPAESEKNFEIVSPPIVSNTPNVVRLTWNAVPNAIRYQISYADKVVISPTTGVEVEVHGTDEVFKITALDFDRNVVAENVPIASTEINPKSPRTTTEFDQMSYPPLYLVYSWIPTKDAEFYEIRLWRNDELVRKFWTEFYPDERHFDFYDDSPVIEDGEYFWQVRGYSSNGDAITDWSEKNSGNTCEVTSPARFSAIGDSITHGGAMTVPPSHVLCNWETYCSFFVKNLGHSGDTTQQILNRFDRDVLPFKPEILFIMAGVNDFRTGVIGSYSVRNLEEMKARCEEYGIIPVFITPTPINPAAMHKVNLVDPPPSDWRNEQRFICDWVRSQKFFIDVTSELTDAEGNLKSDLTTDGLHPDSVGKKIIGQAVEKWLNDYLTTQN